MQENILKELSKITDEERRILDEHKGIDTHIYTEKKELIIDPGKLLKKGKLITVRPHTRFVHFPKHKHNYVEVIYMCKGSTTHIIDGERVVLEEGDLLFLNQKSEQEILPASESDIAVNFIILPQFFDTAYTMIQDEDSILKDFLIDTLRGDTISHSYLYFHVSEVLPIQNLLENMIWNTLYNETGKRRINQVTMGLLVIQLLNHIDKMEVGTDKADREFVSMVLTYIEEHYKDGNLSDLSMQMGYEVYYLSRAIKKHTGHTFKELIVSKRMNQAVFLLSHTTLPIYDIIENIGYENVSYFYRQFAKRYDMSPKEYRDKMTSDKI